MPMNRIHNNQACQCLGLDVAVGCQLPHGLATSSQADGNHVRISERDATPPQRQGRTYHAFWGHSLIASNDASNSISYPRACLMFVLPPALVQRFGYARLKHLASQDLFFF